MYFRRFSALLFSKLSPQSSVHCITHPVILIIVGDEEMKRAIGVAALLVWLVSTGPAQAETIRCYIKQFDIWGAPPHQQIYDANITVSLPNDAKKGKIRWQNDDRAPGAVLGHARQGTIIIEEIFHGSPQRAKKHLLFITATGNRPKPSWIGFALIDQYPMTVKIDLWDKKNHRPIYIHKTSSSGDRLVTGTCP